MALLSLCSSTPSLLDVRPLRCITVDNRLFATAGHGPLYTSTQGQLRNSLLSHDIQSATSLTMFRQKLKTHLFCNHTQTLFLAALPQWSLRLLYLGQYK